MTARPEKRIRGGFLVCVVLFVAAVVVPRFVTSDAGLAIAGGAIVTFLGLFAAAAAAGLTLLVYTLKRFDSLSAGTRLLGIAPGVILAAGLAAILAGLAY